jgi:hypothetical protein
MATALSRTHAQPEHTTRLDCRYLQVPAMFRRIRGKVDGSPVSFSDCGRLVHDIVLSLLCGVSMGVIVAFTVCSF